MIKNSHQFADSGCFRQVSAEQRNNNGHRKVIFGAKKRFMMDINALFITLYREHDDVGFHAQRTEEYCGILGRRLRLSSAEKKKLFLFSLFHDIGKIEIDPYVLNKSGSLTPAEWIEIKCHPEFGCKIAKSIPELSPISDLILTHHEWWDGTGYPRGLKGEEIPYLSRIISVADAFDAMTSDRAYRSALTVRDAVLELERNAGKQFDPEIAGLFIGLLKGTNKRLP